MNKDLTPSADPSTPSPLLLADCVTAGVTIQHNEFGQTLDFVPLRGAYSINWIPAFAGMTCYFIRAGSINREATTEESSVVQTED